MDDARIIASIGDAMCAQNAAGAVKTQVDLDRYKVVIAETRPDLIIETGTHRGASALWFADQSGALIVTVDVVQMIHHTVASAWNDRVRMMLGSSTDANLVAEVGKYAAQAERVMVVLDSDHAAEHVYRELCAYGPMVSPGCYLVCEDTIVRFLPWTGYAGSPWDAVERYLGEHPDEWEIDQRIEDLSPTTQHPDGWLRRL